MSTRCALLPTPLGTSCCDLAILRDAWEPFTRLATACDCLSWSGVDLIGPHEVSHGLQTLAQVRQVSRWRQWSGCSAQPVHVDAN